MTILEFPLAWRWTQPSHAVLPVNVLAQIRPLTRSEIALLDASATSEGGPTSSCSAEQSHIVSTWLRRVQPDVFARVIVRWNEELAVETTWEIFTNYWDDFCYPSSDNVMVTPITGTWQLAYHHYELFDFTVSS